MTTSPQWAPSVEPDAGADLEFDLLVDESAYSGATVWDPASDAEAATGEPGAGWTDVSDGRPYAEHTGSHSADHTGSHSAEHTGSHTAPSTEYCASAGTPGRGVILSAGLGAAAVAVLNLALVGRLSLFFDVSFVVVCLVAAMAVRSRDLFTAAVLPPLAFAGVIAGVALIWPEAILSGSSLGKTFLTGLTAHAAGLVGGYAAALLTVAARAYARRLS